MADPADQRYPDLELLKFRLLTEMQAELTTWAKRRFSVLAIVVAVVGTFGFTTILTQIIQGLVSANVKSSVDTEISSLKTSINAQLQYARDIVDQQLSRLDQHFDRTANRLDNTIERATRKELILEHATVEAQESAGEARRSISTAFEQLNTTREAISSAAKDAERLKNDYQSLKENYGRFGEDISSRVNRSESMVARNKKELQVLHDRLLSVEAAIAEALTTMSLDDAKVGAILASYADSTNSAEIAYREILNQFDHNSKAKVIVFVQRGKGLVENAEILSSRFRSEGFESEVWITDSEEQMGALSNIATYFGGIDPILKEKASGFIHRAGRDDRADIIANILKEAEGYQHTERLDAQFVASGPVRRNLKGDNLSSSDIYLIYKTAE